MEKLLLRCVVLFTVTSCFQVLVATETIIALQGQVLSMLANRSQDINQRPPTLDGSPVEVTVNLFLRPDTSIDPENDEFSIQLTYRQEWTDERLRFDNDNANRYEVMVPYVVISDVTKYWIPDTFFRNERVGYVHQLMRPNAFMRVYPDGKVMYSARLTLKLHCAVSQNLVGSYPFDTPTCGLFSGSYGFTTDDLVLKWREDEPVQVMKNHWMPDYSLSKYSTDTCTSSTNTGEYSCLEVQFVFRRNSLHFLLHLYLPTFLYVTTSWITFWLPHDTFTRPFVILLTTAGLSLQLQSNRSLFLPLPYLTVLDIWCGFCSTMVFCVLVEYIYISYVLRRRGASGGQEEQSKAAEDGQADALPHLPAYKFLWGKTSGRAPKVDVLSRVVFPLTFLAFNLLYWPIYGR